jgi:hypothetical protein
MIAVDSLRAVIRFDGRNANSLFLLAPEWRLRLNGLLRNVIRREGTLSVLRVLCELDQSYRSDGMFLFLPCQDVYLKPTVDSSNEHAIDFNGKRGDISTDLDLLYIKDGRVGIGEVKSSPSHSKWAISRN